MGYSDTCAGPTKAKEKGAVKSSITSSTVAIALATAGSAAATAEAESAESTESAELPATQITTKVAVPQISVAAATWILDHRGVRLADDWGSWASFAKMAPIFAKAHSSTREMKAIPPKINPPKINPPKIHGELDDQSLRNQNSKLEDGPVLDVMNAFQTIQKSDRG